MNDHLERSSASSWVSSFTCFTITRVQMLTPDGLLLQERAITGVFELVRRHDEQVRTGKLELGSPRCT